MSRGYQSWKAGLTYASVFDRSIESPSVATQNGEFLDYANKLLYRGFTQTV